MGRGRWKRMLNREGVRSLFKKDKGEKRPGTPLHNKGTCTESPRAFPRLTSALLVGASYLYKPRKPFKLPGGLAPLSYPC